MKKLSETDTVSPECIQLCDQMQMLLIGVDAGDALNALANIMMVLLIQVADDVEDAEDNLDIATGIIKEAINENWDQVKADQLHSHGEGGRA